MEVSPFLREDNAMILPSRPIPPLEDELWASFYAYCAQRELRFQRCENCQLWRHPPRRLCAGCHSTRWDWEVSTGRGRVHSWTVVHHAFHPAFANDLPFAILIGEMEEGVRLIARLRKGDLGRASLVLDLPVAVQFEPISDNIALPLFVIEPLV